MRGREHHAGFKKSLSLYLKLWESLKDFRGKRTTWLELYFRATLSAEGGLEGGRRVGTEEAAKERTDL